MPMVQTWSEIGSRIVVDKRKVADGANPISNTSRDNAHSNTSIDARLAAIGGVFTTAYIQTMTYNDKIYALRVNDEAAGI